MLCPSPNVSSYSGTESTTVREPLIASMRLVTDAFHQIPHQYHSVDTIVYFPDPIFYKFTIERQYHSRSDDYLTIKVCGCK